MSETCTTCNPTIAATYPAREQRASCPDCWDATGTGPGGPAGYPSGGTAGAMISGNLPAEGGKAIGGYGSVPHGASGYASRLGQR